MQRFRLLGFYVAGVATVVGLTVWADSVRRGTDETRTPEAPTGEVVAPPTSKVVKVSIDNFVFGPKELVVAAGATVTWVNADDVPHTATSKSSPPLFDSKTLRAGEKFSFEFKTPGTYDYFCKAHPYMIGKVIVK
jgi:plastocyanin